MNNMNIFRFRLFNLKLLGNIRFGLFKEISVEETIEFIRDFRDFYEQRNKINDELQQQKSSGVTENSNFKILERLCEQYYVHEETDKFKRKIIQEVQEIIEELRNDSQTQKDLERWLNETQDNIVAKLRSSHPELKNEEIRLFCYIQAGFTATMISVLLKKEKSVVYNRISRLKAKIKE